MTTRCRTLLLLEPCLAHQALGVLARDDQDAILDGRLFVDRRRIQDPSEQLSRGQVVSWNAPRELAAKQLHQPQLVLERRGGYIAAAKPAAWSSEPDRAGSASCLRDRLAQLLHLREIHVLTRLDVGVSGLVLTATDARSRQHWTKVMVTGCHRRYVAILAGGVPDTGTWQGVVDQTRHATSPPAKTHFETLARVSLGSNVSLGGCGPRTPVSLVQLRPETGHRHQLRIHSSRAHFPIVGDRRYAGPSQFTDAAGRVVAVDRIFLHALTMTVPLPDGTLWKPSCPVDDSVLEFWLRLGGVASDFAKISQ